MKKNLLIIMLLAIALGAISSLPAQALNPARNGLRPTLLFEDFGTVAADWPVAGWTQKSGLYPTPTGTTTQWVRDEWLNGPAGNNAAKINIYGTSRFGWLITPAVTIPADGYELKFDLGLTDWNYPDPIEDPNAQQDDRFMVIMSDSPEMTNPVILREYNNTGSQFVFNAIPNTGTEVIVHLTGITGTKYFAFYGESTASGGDNDLFVDNVMIRDTPTSPQFYVSPASANFGQVLLGSSASQDFMVRNTGIGTLVISSINLPTNPHFTLTGVPALPANLNVGESITFTAVYAPAGQGEHSATISITDNLARVVNSVPLSGIGFDATVNTLPVSEYWDSVTAPAIPVGWSTILNSTSTSAYVRTSTTSPFSAPNCVQIANSADTEAQLYLISPLIGNAIDMNSIRVKLMAKGGTNYSLQIGTMSNPADPTTFALAQDLSVVANWNEYVVNLSGHTPAGRYIAARHGLGGTYRTIYVDDVHLELIAPNDLAAISISGNATPSVGAPSTYTVNVFNNGTATQSNYQVKLYNQAGTELASVAGPTITAGETIGVQLSWTPSVVGPETIYGKLILVGDVNTTNDQTPNMSLTVQPEGIHSVTIGDGGELQGIPWEFYYRNSLFQTLYYQNEIGMFGNITALSFYSNFTTNFTSTPVKVWLGTTDLPDLSAGWIDPSTLTLVYDGSVAIPSGANILTIPLQVPYNYSGGNLVLYANRPWDVDYHSPTDDFQAQTVGTNRARKLVSDSTTYDPLAPSAAGTLSGTFPKTTLIMTPLGPDPIFAVTPPGRDFGQLILGTSANQDFRVMNVGGGTLNVNSISISGSPAFSLGTLPTLPAQLVTGQHILFNVGFTPTEEGLQTATVTITDNRRMTHTVVLSGSGFDATITALPASENWDTATVPDFPLGWSTIFNSTSTSAYLRTSTTSPFSAPNCVQMANSADANAQLYLVSPPIADDIQMNSIRIRMMAKGGANYVLDVGTMSNPSDASTFVLAEQLTVVANWNEYVISLAAHTAAGQFIAVRHGLGATSRTIYIDDVSLELIAPNDLAAVAITGNTTPPVNSVANYQVSVYNNGTASQSAYQVKLFNSSDLELATVAGPAVAAGETVQVELSWTPTEEGLVTLYGKVVLPGDVNPANDSTNPINVNVTAADVFIVEVGNDTTVNTTSGVPTPYGTWYKNFRQQFLYPATDLYAHGAVPGAIYALAFNVSALNTCSPMPNYRIRLKNTDQTALTTTFEVGDYTQVYMQDNFMPTEGWNLHVFDAPFMWDGVSNVIVDILTDLIPGNYTQNASVYYTPTTYASSLRYQSDSAAASAATTGTIASNRSNTRFYLNVEDMGSLSGVVSSNGTPLEGVELSVVGSYQHTTTNANGEYNIPFVEVGTHSLLAHKIGYEDQNQAFTITVDENTVLNINMVPSASVSVSGMVVGSDNPSVGLDQAEILLSGVLNYSGTTNAAGQFTIPNVLSGNTFNVTILRGGYQMHTSTIQVGATDYNMGTITLLELTLPPSGVVATLNDAQTQVSLVWREPGGTGNEFSFDFETSDGGWEPSSNWTDPEGDWEYTDSYDVSQWAPVNPGTNIVPPPTAFSGTGLWGTVIYSNYTNSGGFSYLSKTFNFSGFTNTEMRFRSWENVFGNFDYCQITANGTLVWGPSWQYTGTQWEERIVDLSAFDGQSEVVIRFEMYASTVVDYGGWYIDDVEIGPARSAVVSSPAMEMPEDMKGLDEISAARMAEQRAASTRNVRDTLSSRNVRTNPSRIPVGYKVWRLTVGQESTPDSWISLTPAVITDTTFVDPSWPTLPDGRYKWAVRTVYTGDVLSNPGFSNFIRKQPNDLSALTVSGNSTPSVGNPVAYTVRIHNTGTSAQAAGAYTVKLMSNGVELASANGPAIGIDAEVDVAVNWTPTTEGDVSIYGKVVLPLDSDATNDETPPINLNVFPAGQFAYTVGDGSLLERVPVDMYYKASLFQMLIYPAELSNFVGFINGLQFYNNFVTDLPDKPTKIWIETTTVEDLSAGWIPVTTNSTLVYDGVVNYPSGENTIPIIFPTPYMYLNPQNLLITIQRPLDASFFNTNDKFRAQTIGTNRARKMQSDTVDFDPANPSSQGTLSGLIPRTTIIGIPGSVGHLSGTVTVSGGAALEGVLVELVDAGYSATTDADGHYQIQYILPDTYTVSFSRYGYVTQTQTLVLEEEEEAVMNAVMQPMATVAVSGTVLASDTGAGLGGAVIQLTGYANYNAVSGGNGTFTIPAVYANQAYEYHIAAPGYVPETGTITVGSTAHQMDNIVLNEIAFAPHSVIAELSDDYSSIELEWEAPDPNAMEMLESFEDAQFPPVDWSQIITNTGPANSSGVYPTFTRLPTINAQNVIAPTHGMFQTGLWWTYEHQDEWLITPAFNCPPEGFMTFDSYVFLGSTNGDHYYVKVSTDGGNNWTPIWDASAETGGQITYNQPIFVDLSDYTSQQISLAFHAEDPPSNDGLWYTWFIDNIYIGNANTMVRFESPVITRSTRTTTSSTPAAEAITRGTQRNTIVGNTSRSVEIPQKRTERSLVGYYLYRLTTGQEANEASWDTLTDEPVSILSYTDDAWDDLQNGSYRWAVKAVYTAGVLSGPAFSNTMVKETVTGNLVGFIRRSNGTGIPGARIRTGTYSATTNTSGAYFLALPVGTYTITVTATGFTSQEITDVLISPNQNTTLNVVLTPTSNEDDVIPVTVTVLKGNSPNPFNPETNIAFDLAQAGPVSLEIFNIKGQRVRTLINKPMPAGRHRIVFDARDDRGKPLGSGVYLYRFRSGEYQSTRKMMLME